MTTVTVQDAVNELKDKRPVIIFDRENENEGDIVYPSEIINDEIIKFMMNECKGVICQTLPIDLIKKLKIPIFKTKRNTLTGQTNFVYPVDHINSETGISCKDRTLIIKSLVDENFNPDHIVIPGHQNLLKISENGILERQGHTEASSELVTLANYFRSATICEIINENGIPMRLAEIIQFSNKHNIKIVLLNDIHNHFLNENMIKITPQIKFVKNVYPYLNNKRAIVSGGSSGIGEAICKLLKENNCEIINISRSEGYDITDYEKITTFIKNLDDAPVHYLINAAGYINVQNTENMSIEEWNKHFNVNVTGIFNLIKSVLLKYKTNGLTSIINITSAAATFNRTRAGWSAYTASKTALETFTRILAAELNPSNIKVYGLSPSKTDTQMLHAVFKNLDKTTLLVPINVAKLAINILAQSISLESGNIYTIGKQT